ncbi:MAG: hypothetical protein RSB78_01740, partial [Oscillospiraceae bacterium]
SHASCKKNHQTAAELSACRRHLLCSADTDAEPVRAWQTAANQLPCPKVGRYPTPNVGYTKKQANDGFISVLRLLLFCAAIACKRAP